MKGQGKIDERVSLSADQLQAVVGGYPWFNEADGEAAVIDISKALGGAAEAALGADFEFSHISYSFAADATGATLAITYVDPDEDIGGVRVRWFLDGKAGMRVVPVGFTFKKAAYSCLVTLDGGAIDCTLCLHGVRN